MVYKNINYDVYLRATNIKTPAYETLPQVMSNDKESVKIRFNVRDVEPEELVGATAEVLLFMQDGSFFQKPSSEVLRENTTFSYVLKANESRHVGVTKVQVSIKFGGVENSSKLYGFEIVGGLETKPILEKEIQDWTSLTFEAKAFVDEFKDKLQNIEDDYDARLEASEARINAWQTQEEARERAEEDRVEGESEREANEQTRLDKDRLRDDKIAQMDSEVILARGDFNILGDRLDDIDRELSQLPIMGVEWGRTADPTMTRIGASKGLVANIGIGDEIVRNDFDTMPIYREMQRETDKYGNVFARIPKFYIRKTVTNELYRVEISTEKLKGFYLPAIFYDFEKDKELEYSLIGAYLASNSADGTKLESKAGVKPLASRNIVQFRGYATANGEGYQQLDIHAVDVLQTLFRVEFATLNSQSLHPGFTAGDAESASTGGADELTATSGAMGTSSSHQFVYRGIEDPWGNVYQFVDGVNINDHQAWVCRDARQYTSNGFASPYEKLGYINAAENMWVTEMGYDSNNPFAEFPISGGGGTTTYYADHYYQNVGQRIALFGGSWSFGTTAGLSFWHLSGPSASASSSLGGRLVRKPL